MCKKDLINKFIALLASKGEEGIDNLQPLLNFTQELHKYFDVKTSMNTLNFTEPSQDGEEK